jgi:hypothetical protein
MGIAMRGSPALAASMNRVTPRLDPRLVNQGMGAALNVMNPRLDPRLTNQLVGIALANRALSASTPMFTAPTVPVSAPLALGRAALPAAQVSAPQPPARPAAPQRATPPAARPAVQPAPQPTKTLPPESPQEEQERRAGQRLWVAEGLLLQKDVDARDRAEDVLTDLLKRYPDTTAAKKGKTLLTSLGAGPF